MKDYTSDKPVKKAFEKAKGKYKEAMSNFRRDNREEKSFDRAFKARGLEAKGGKMSRPDAEKQAVRMYREGAAAAKRPRKY